MSEPDAWRRVLRGPLAAALALLCVGCARTDARAPIRLLLIGADGLDWKVALPLVEAGRMPELAEMMRRGRFGRLQTAVPTVSPALWTSIATGKSAARHGIVGFGQREPAGRREFRPFTSLDRRTKALWDILSEAGRASYVVGWWMTYPVDPIRGVMVAQTNTATGRQVRGGEGIRKGSLVSGVPDQVHPAERQPEMLAVLRDVDASLVGRIEARFGRLPDAPGSPAVRLWQACTWAFRADSTYAEIAERLAAEGDADLLAVYFGGTDVVAHRFWRYMEPERFDDRPSAAETQAFGGVIERYYEYLDATLGELRRASGAATVIVVADHGMGPYRTTASFSPDAPLRELLSGNHLEGPPGVFAAAGAGIAAPASGAGDLDPDALPIVGSIYDVAPTALALLGLPVAKDMDGAPMLEVLDPAFLAQHPVRQVDSYETAEWREARQRRRPVEVDERERIEQLRELGYVD